MQNESCVARDTSDIQYHFRGRRVPEFARGLSRKAPEYTVTGQSMTEAPSALETQVGGGHYKTFEIQPIEFVHKNNLNFIQGNVIKYITRYKQKNGREDLEKVKHYVDLLIALEYPE